VKALSKEGRGCLIKRVLNEKGLERKSMKPLESPVMAFVRSFEFPVMLFEKFFRMFFYKSSS
jgi:hypothetical protein